MKTVDLIPFILHELNEQDKYGFELTKSIETKSNGRIVIKQATLYTILKKLEKSKFISSYWQDSDIGGKRHYYKLTEFGKLQVSTLPSSEELFKAALSNEETDAENDFSEEIIQPIQSLEPKETIIPTEAVFGENSAFTTIDNSTEADINLNNIETLKDEVVKQQEDFAANINVAKFTEKAHIAPVIETNFEESTTNLMPNIDESPTSITTYKTIKYVSYTNIKKDENYIKSKKIAKKMMIKSILVSFTLLVVLGILNIVVESTSKSAIYHTSWIIALIVAIFYPIVCSASLEKLKENINKKDFNLNNKKNILINFGLILAVMIVVLVANLALGITTINTMFALSNFGNLYAPLILSSVGLFDCIFYKMLFKK